MPTEPPFWDLDHACKELGIEQETLLQIAAEGKIALSIHVPHAITLCTMAHSITNSESDDYAHVLAERDNHRYATLDADTCSALLRNHTVDTTTFPTAHDLTTSNYKAPVKISPSLHHSPISSWKEFAVPSLPKQKTFRLDPPLNRAKYGLELFSYIACNSQRVEPIAITRSTLGVMHAELERYKKQRIGELPPDELDKEESSPFLIDMNNVARQVYAQARNNNNHYPSQEDILKALQACTSFSNPGTSSSRKAASKLLITAAQVIKPRRFQGRTRRELNKDEAYISEDFRVLLDVSRELRHSPDPHITIAAIKKKLEEKRMSENLAKDAPGLLL